MVILYKFWLCFELVHVVDGFVKRWSIGKKYCWALIAEDCVSVVVTNVFDEGDLQLVCFLESSSSDNCVLGFICIP